MSIRRPSLWIPRAISLVVAIVTCGCQASAGEPRVAVVYRPWLDSACSFVRGVSIEDEWKAELVARRSEFEAIWEDLSPRLLAATEAITGEPLLANDVTANLTLCDLPSQSIAGISVNMRFALRSFTPTPVPTRYKVDTLFHELLHDYIARHPIRRSALLAEHAREPKCTRNHLHLLALQKAVLLSVGQSEALRTVIATDSQLPSGCYRRAWALVNATDTEYSRYVAEVVRE
jgi:hypothetical protein